MKKPYIKIVLLLLCCITAHTAEALKPLRCKINSSEGTIQLWSKNESKMIPLDDGKNLGSKKTLFTKEQSTIHLTFEPLIDLIIKENTTFCFDNLAIEPKSGIIRMRCAMESGAIRLNAPRQAGKTLLFTLATPAATIDAAMAEFSVKVDKNGLTLIDVYRGSVKALPNESTMKTALNGGSRGEIKRAQPHITISALSDSIASKKADVRQRQPSIAILSIKSKIRLKDNLEHISNAVAQEFEKSTKAKVLFLDDIKKLLQAEGANRLLDCFSDSCISRIGARAGVDIVIVGNLGQLGKTHVLDLKMVDVLRDKMMKRTSVTANEDLGLILKEIPVAINDLVSDDSLLNAVVSVPEKTLPGTSQYIYKEKVVWIFPGSFEMGSRSKTGEADELPKHRVKLDGFFIDRFEVTRDEFKELMGYDPSLSKGCGSCPVTSVTWQEASDFCKKTGKSLPTEAQWEYACRAGTVTPFSTGMTISGEQANFDARKSFDGGPVGFFHGKTIPAGSYAPNNWNLHDMYGNAAEWCHDWYNVAYYGNSVEQNPKGPAKGKLKVVRGGSWKSGGRDLTSSNRMAYNPGLRLNTIGFRCVKNEPDSGK